eukprot:CAMPEP_0196595460 /NCGR_PEP_ID=MMETSP1081-20130531/81197_1 /TAXON_ID=36882 /ORGANISM="Pyramimonas amylifera, Strain CCMP720" /LENGTH=176 /DNA_ID=CAMNT_0041920045 /DNA_START=149 /DNA_END=682 /DNA_ORIENTATION=+
MGGKKKAAKKAEKTARNLVDDSSSSKSGSTSSTPSVPQSYAPVVQVVAPLEVTPVVPAVTVVDSDEASRLASQLANSACQVAIESEPAAQLAETAVQRAIEQDRSRLVKGEDTARGAHYGAEDSKVVQQTPVQSGDVSYQSPPAVGLLEPLLPPSSIPQQDPSTESSGCCSCCSIQ